MSKKEEVRYSAFPGAQYPGQIIREPIGLTYPGDEIENEIPRYHPGSKIFEGGSSRDGIYLTTTPDIKVKTKSPYPDPIDRVLDHAGQQLNTRYGVDSFPCLVEMPKPEKLLRVIEIVAEALRRKYPTVRPIDPSQVLWVDKPGMADIAGLIDEDQGYSLEALKKMGYELGLKDPSEMTHFVSPEKVARVGLSAETFKDMDNDKEPWLKVNAEFDTIVYLIKDALFQAPTHQFIPYNDEIARLFSRVIDNDVRNIPKMSPGIDMDKLKQMALRYRRYLANPKDTLIEAVGGKIRYAKRIDEDGFDRYEVLMSTGNSINDEIRDFLMQPVAELAFQDLTKLYAPELQKAAAESYRDGLKIYNRTNPSIRAQQTLQAYGINSYDDALNTYLNSNLITSFLEAKKKRKKLEYPLD